MDDRKLVTGGFYKHFKNKMYQVRGVAYHSETREKMVIYQALYGSYSLYVRPYDMFMSEVDHVKYPDVLQKYRFEQVSPDGSPIMDEQEKEAEYEQQVNPIEHLRQLEQVDQVSIQIAEASELTQNTTTQADFTQNVAAQSDSVQQDKAQNELSDPNSEGQIDAGLLMFLDADNYQEKLNTLTLLRDKLTDNMINTMAASMDIEVADGPMDMRYNSLRNCILAHAKYECTRLR